MSVPSALYAWSAGSFFYLSVFPREQNRGRNKYASREELEAAASDRNDKQTIKIVWEDGSSDPQRSK